MPKTDTTSDAFARLVAGFAGADLRTVRRFLAGKSVKGTALAERLEAAKVKASIAVVQAAQPKPPAKARRPR